MPKTDLLSELYEEQSKARSPQCKTCTALRKLPDDVREQLKEALAKDVTEIGHVTIEKVLERREELKGLRVNQDSIGKHRRGYCGGKE